MRAGLTHDSGAPLPAVADLVHLAGSVHVDDVERRAGLLGQRDGAQRGLYRPPSGSGAGVPDRGGLAGGQNFSGEHLDHIAVLGMQHGQHAVLSAPAHDLEDLAVLQPQPPVVGGEYLQGGDPLPDQRRDLGHHLGIETGDVHVEAEIDGRLGIGLGVPGVDALAQGVEVLRHEIQHGGGAAESGRLQAAVVVVGGHRVEHGEIKVGVGVDPAGQHQLAGGVDHFRTGRLQSRTDGSNGLAFDEQIFLGTPPHGDEGCPADQQSGHWLGSSQGVRLGESAIQVRPPSSVEYSSYDRPAAVRSSPTAQPWNSSTKLN